MSRVQLVGILNVTPDSFSDGGKFNETDKALEHAAQLFSDGASLVDVGAEATNPWAKPISAAEEWQRLAELIPALLKAHPGKISLDTRHPETAKQFLESGGTVLNDVSGFRDLGMIELAAKHKPLCIVNHFPGADPAEVHTQKIDDTEQVKNELLAKRDELIQAGVPSCNVILDPGIGFGKTMEFNRQLLEFAKFVPDVPVMIGHSRKRFLGDDRFEIAPNLAAAQIAIDSGAAYLRVHDVKEHKALL